jgi:cation transport protein ChaC
LLKGLASSKLAVDFSKMWIFGYGSLIWKAEFEYEEKVVGYIDNFVRRFWQGSSDNRGTIENPGRVVTLIPYDEWKLKYSKQDPHSGLSRCYGVAYRIHPDKVESTKSYLDFREKDGYMTNVVDIVTQDVVKFKNGIIKDAVIYIATSENASFLGPGELNQIARQIATCKGDSGYNLEYLLKLCEAHRTIAPQVKDDHLEELEGLIQHVLRN